jgi:hypothetical protein
LNLVKEVDSTQSADEVYIFSPTFFDLLFVIFAFFQVFSDVQSLFKKSGIVEREEIGLNN